MLRHRPTQQETFACQDFLPRTTARRLRVAISYSRVRKYKQTLGIRSEITGSLQQNNRACVPAADSNLRKVRGGVVYCSVEPRSGHPLRFRVELVDQTQQLGVRSSQVRVPDRLVKVVRVALLNVARGFDYLAQFVFL